MWSLIAPGPSASAELAQKVRGLHVGAVGNAFQLAPFAEFIAASDAAWWAKYPEAMNSNTEKFSMGKEVKGVELVSIPELGGGTMNSGVLALECAKRKGATKILLIGFDMRGSHFFGKYVNGLRNTSNAQRANHLKQYESWARANRKIEVVNCTTGSAIECFPKAILSAVLPAAA